jgi:tetratricopeptide (TPR) repeat protein
MKKIVFILSFIAVCGILFSACSRCSKKNETQTQDESIDSRLAELTKQIDAAQDDHKLWHSRALLYLELKMPYEALSDINRALQLDPENTSYSITLADIYFSMGHFDNCRKALISAQDNDPSNVEPVLKLAELDLILKDYEKMNLYLNKALEIDNSNAQVFFMRGVALKEQGDSLAALRSLHQATSFDPEHYRSFVEAGILASELGDPIAVEYLSTALNLKPASIEARYALAMYYQKNAMLNEAMKEYYNILTIDKKHAPSHYNLGYIHLVDLQLYNQAIGHFSDAIQSNPNYAEAYYNRGYSYELLGNVEAARKDYQEALAIKTNYKLALDGLQRIERVVVFQ